MYKEWQIYKASNIVILLQCLETSMEDNRLFVRVMTHHWFSRYPRKVAILQDWFSRYPRKVAILQEAPKEIVMTVRSFLKYMQTFTPVCFHTNARMGGSC